MPQRRQIRTSKRGRRWRVNKARRFSRRRFLLGAAGLAAAASAAGAFKWLPQLSLTPSNHKPGRRHLLNGVWDFQPASAPLQSPPKPHNWGSIRVPSEWNMTAPPNFETGWGAYDIWDTPRDWDEATAGWYRTRFEVQKMPRGRLTITFEAVNFAARVYVNGHLAGSHRGGTVPFTVDATPYIYQGDNTLLVGVTGPQGVKGPNGFVDPMGSWWGQLCGGIWQDVWLAEEDLVKLSDLSVETSVQHQTLDVNAFVSNHDSQDQVVHVSLAIWDKSRIVLRHDRVAAVAAHQTVPVRWSTPWHDADLWTPDAPHLYQLTADVRTDGQVRDSSSLRFGFREVWVQGDTLLLNGKPLRLFGDEWHYFGSLENSRSYAEAWYRMAKAAHANYIRLHAMPYPPVFYDVADEMGMLIVAESAIYGSSKNLNLKSPVFWENAHTHLVDRVRRDRHHPSIILWSAENEVLAAYGPSWASQVAALKPSILSQDRTRPIYFEGDDDPAGAADLISWHYPLEITEAPALPDSFYAYVPGDAQGSRWKRTKPLMISEFGLMWEAGPMTVSVAYGDSSFQGMEDLWQAQALITRAQIEGFRAAGVTGIAPWNLVWYGSHPLPGQPVALPAGKLDSGGPKPLRVGKYASTINPGWQPSRPAFLPNPIHFAIADSFRPLAALSPSWAQRAFAGDDLRDPIIVHNDTPERASLTLTWTWAGGGHTVSDKKTVSIDGTGQTPLQTHIRLPRTVRPIAGTLTLSLSAAGQGEVERRSRPMTIYPQLGVRRAGVSLVDPAGSTSKVLKARGYDVAPWDGHSFTRPIIVAENTAPAPALWSALAVAVRQGAKVLVLSQPSGWSPMAGLAVGRVAVTRTFVEAPHHPLFRGLGPDPLSWWQGADNLAAAGLFTIPDDPAFWVASDGGANLSGAGLLQWQSGSGQAWFCQYPLIERMRLEPVAERLLAGLVDALSQTSPLRPLSYWGNRLTAFFGGTPAAVLPQAPSLLVLDCSDATVVGLAASHADSLKRFVHAGGRLWLHHGSQAEALVTQLTGWRPKKVDIPPTHQQGGLNRYQSPLSDNISNAVLNWSTGALAASGWRGVKDSARLLMSIPVDWSQYAKPEQVKQASVLLSQRPQAVLAFARRLGRGDIVVEELNWDADSTEAQVLRARLIAALIRS